MPRKDPAAKRAYQRDWYRRNRDRLRTKGRSYDPAKSAAYQRRHKYGLTPEDFDRMVEEQGGRCAICGEEKALHVDHDHNTGRVRGLLCNRCNTGLRVVEEPKRLAASVRYLKETSVS